MTIKILSSCLMTAGVTAMMSLYLLLGRIGVLPLHPAVMISLASMLILQSCFVFTVSLYRLRKNALPAEYKQGKRKWDIFSGNLAEAEHQLIKAGFNITATYTDGTVFISKNFRRTLLIEAVLYAALTGTLLLGLINYARGMSGTFMVSEAVGLLDLKSSAQDIRKGFFADLPEIDYKIRVDSLKYATSGGPSSISISISDRQGKQWFSGTVRDGESFNLKNVLVRYSGDVFFIYLSVMKKDHDFLPGPLYLEHSPDTLYRGRINMREPGAFGEVEYEPNAGMFRIKVYEKGMLLFDRKFAESNEASEGDFRVSVTAKGHFGKFGFRRHTYRNQILASLTLLFVSLLARMIWRPSKVYIRLENNSVMFSTKNRLVKKVLRQG